VRVGLGEIEGASMESRVNAVGAAEGRRRLRDVKTKKKTYVRATRAPQARSRTIAEMEIVLVNGI